MTASSTPLDAQFSASGVSASLSRNAASTTTTPTRCVTDHRPPVARRKNAFPSRYTAAAPQMRPAVHVSVCPRGCRRTTSSATAVSTMPTISRNGTYV
ncbi:hypothetical protein ASG23_01440 [Cellulomonas sp. Leaf395]|nr:hypothetical protein ASG23_01440 [Cellulomonas sp. Leaf395]